jgi:hypothetical protein
MSGYVNVDGANDMLLLRALRLQLLQPVVIADAFCNVVHQDRRAWTYELD